MLSPERVAIFWSLVDRTSDCWLWTAGRFTNGYGSFNVPGRGSRKSHRLAYELVVGSIPEGLVLDHLCRNRACCNPEHLEPVTQRENLLRGDTFTAANVAKTHCANGHEFSPENTRIERDGGRVCRICARANWQRWNARRKESA